MLKILFSALAAALVAVLLYAASRPDQFRVERSVLIQAPAPKIHALINDFHQWEAWSPWEKIDPQLQRTYSGAPRGPGAVYTWSGDKNVGQGRMEITRETVPTHVQIQLDFVTPFEAHNTVEFILDPQGDQTRVTQAMWGPSPFVSKLMGLVFSMDKMVGDKYEEGLANLKRVAER